MKILINGLYLHGHTKVSLTDLKVIIILYSIKKQYHMKVLLNSFHLNGHTLRFHTQT